MRLTKYQKARLLEFEWDLLQNESDDDTCWLQFDATEKDVLCNIIRILNLPQETQQVKLLVVATQSN